MRKKERIKCTPAPDCIKEFTQGEQDDILENEYQVLVNLRALLPLPWVDSLIHVGLGFIQVDRSRKISIINFYLYLGF